VKISGIIWLDSIVEKLARKHNVDPEEVAEIFQNKPRFLLVEKGSRKGENVYMALGRTDAGRALVVFFIYKPDCRALILSARDMSKSELKKSKRGKKS
jgi:uncharacterized DUF497 family protein